jgi:hypothetical protein
VFVFVCEKFNSVQLCWYILWFSIVVGKTLKHAQPERLISDVPISFHR